LIFFAYFPKFIYQVPVKVFPPVPAKTYDICIGMCSEKLGDAVHYCDNLASEFGEAGDYDWCFGTGAVVELEDAKTDISQFSFEGDWLTITYVKTMGFEDSQPPHFTRINLAVWPH
jgi:hypothetical protein